MFPGCVPCLESVWWLDFVLHFKVTHAEFTLLSYRTAVNCRSVILVHTCVADQSKTNHYKFWLWCELIVWNLLSFVWCKSLPWRAWKKSHRWKSGRWEKQKSPVWMARCSGRENCPLLPQSPGQWRLARIRSTPGQSGTRNRRPDRTDGKNRRVQTENQKVTQISRFSAALFQLHYLEVGFFKHQ